MENMIDSAKRLYVRFSDICCDPKNKNYFCIISGSLLGVISFLAIYGTYTLDVTNDGWLLRAYLENDVNQHYAGWLMFRNSPWSWPLGFASEIGYPIGASISYTDSIPLVSIFFKIFDPVLPETFQFFGWWILACFILQGIAAAKLISLFTENRMAIMIITEFFVIAPILVERSFRHHSLAAQFFIIFALYYYFKGRRENKLFQLQFLLLSGTVAGIHPYYMPLVLGLVFIGMIEYAIRNKKIIKPMLVFLLNLVLVILCCLVVGVFSIGTKNFAYGDMYGECSLNLNALFNPFSVGGIMWSRVIPQMPQILYQADGFNYLGMGIIIAATISVVLFFYLHASKRKNLKTFLKKNVWLMLYCLALTAFAVTHLCVINDTKIWEIPIPEWLMNFASIFRASGRLFYPVTYLIFLSSLVFILKTHKKKTAIILLACLLTIQVIDISPALKEKSKIFADYRAQGIIKSNYDTPFWQMVSENYDEIIFTETPYLNFEFSAYIAKQGLRTNLNPISRGNTEKIGENIEMIKEELLSGKGKNNTIYLFSNIDYLKTAVNNFPSQVEIYFYNDSYYVLIPMHDGITVPYDQFATKININEL